VYYPEVNKVENLQGKFDCTYLYNNGQNSAGLNNHNPYAFPNGSEAYNNNNHHQPINVPTAGAQAFLMDYPQGERATTRAQYGLVDNP
jgi:hypothetical protein